MCINVRNFLAVLPRETMGGTDYNLEALIIQGAVCSGMQRIRLMPKDVTNLLGYRFMGHLY